MATIDMGRKEGACCAPFAGRELCPRLTQRAWAEVYFRTKWHLDPSSHLAATDMGRKLEAVPSTNVTDRQTDRQENGPIAGRTALQTVAQKL